MIGLADRKAGVRQRPSFQLVLGLVASIWVDMGSSSDPGLGDRRVPQVFLVAWRAVVNR